MSVDRRVTTASLAEPAYARLVELAEAERRSVGATAAMILESWFRDRAGERRDTVARFPFPTGAR